MEAGLVPAVQRPGESSRTSRSSENSFRLCPRAQNHGDVAPGPRRNQPGSIRSLARALLSAALILGIFGTFELHQRILKAAFDPFEFDDAPKKNPGAVGVPDKASHFETNVTRQNYGTGKKVLNSPEPERCPSRPSKLAPDPTCPRILIYLTTHLSEQHLWHLNACWPPALRNSLLLNSSDVFVYLSRNEDNATNLTDAANATNATCDGADDDGARLLQRTFRHQNLTICARPNLGYQESATAAFSDAVTLGWWTGYDWVVRVNPDVIIRDDSELLGIMHNDANATGVFVNCKKGAYRLPVVHTDFLAIRPAALGGDALLRPLVGGTAETWFTGVVMKPIINGGNHRWIEAAEPKNLICRAGHLRDARATPVVHSHLEAKEGDACPVPFE